MKEKDNLKLLLMDLLLMDLMKDYRWVARKAWTMDVLTATLSEK